MHKSDQTEIDVLNRLLLERLSPITAPADRQTAMRRNLMSRVAASAAKQTGFLTVRARHGQWQSLKAGVRVKQLWNGPQGSSVLIEFAPGASLLPHRHNWLEEGIVLHGGLQMAELDLGRLDYHVSPAGSRHAPIESRQGGLAFLRGTSIGNNAGVLKEVLGGLLPFGKDQSLTVFADDQENWQPIDEGVFRKLLCQDGERNSYFYRFESGARLLNLPHGQEQECMVLDGELFLDNALLLAGDYQLAPAGSRHDEIYSDVGAICFIRGARRD